MGRQAAEKLPETEAPQRSPSSQHGFTDSRRRTLGPSFPRNHRWAISSRERIGLYLHER